MQLKGNVIKQMVRCIPVVAIIFAVGCASTPSPPTYKQAAQPYHTAPVKAPVRQENNTSTPSSVYSDNLQSQLRTTVQQWLGTPHRMGGNSRRGIDCSGFVQHLYKQVFGKSIPRSSTLQVRQGRPVTMDQLVPGDLVFFKPPYKKNHVGIYLGDQQFAHASTSKGVVISDLTDRYWLDCYWTSRRYLNL